MTSLRLYWCAVVRELTRRPLVTRLPAPFYMSNPSNRASMRGQLTLRGVVIGVLGCVIITASSAYTALKMGALPWPIIFAAVISLFFLKLMGNASLNEANVTHTIMSAGAMVAGGLS